MPINTELAKRIWARYNWVRDNGHMAFMTKADKCDAFFRGDQWTKTDLARLIEVRRPALTINKILPTISNVLGEQIVNRNEIAFRPRNGGATEVADVLTKVFKQISDNNQLDWKRSAVFEDGVITSRGFFDVRLGFKDSMKGEVEIDTLNPKNVMVDPDAELMDPDTWKDVLLTKWLTLDDIALLYSAADAKLLRSQQHQDYIDGGADSFMTLRDRFGGDFQYPGYEAHPDDFSMLRNVRVIERQYRKMTKQRLLLAPTSGDTRVITDEMEKDADRLNYIVKQYGFQIITKMVQRIRWTVVANNVVLHDDWSPYKHFTVVPYFPYFRHGRTVGLVENLLGPQELLNKTSSQELHVINTSANSGWKVKAGSLANMSVEELEAKGAQTGLVIETNGDPDDSVVKITPNQIPSGLDRVTFKAEEHIKTISGVPDSAQGFDREDVAAKAIQAKRQAASTNLVKAFDSLTRTDFILARNILDVVQEFYTEERLLTITKDRTQGTTEEVAINAVTPEGSIVNDLTIGEYDVVISSVPQRETLEDSQFDQAMALRELGVAIPDSVLIDSSRLLHKKDILDQLNAASNSPEAKEQAALKVRMMRAEVAEKESSAMNKGADAGLKDAKTQATLAEIGAPEAVGPQGPTPHEAMLAEREQARKEEDSKVTNFVKVEELKEKKRENDIDAALRKEEAAQQAESDRIAQMQTAAQAAAQPKAKA